MEVVRKMPGAENPRVLEGVYTASDYIDGLPTQEYPRASHAVADESPPGTDTPPQKRVAIRPATVVGLLTLVAAFGCGWATAAVQYVTGDRPANVQVTKPESPPTVTVTKTEVRLPESCTKAIRDMRKYLDSAEAVSAAGGLQMDLMDESFQAIMQRDWQKLNELRLRQRKLESDMLPDSSRVIPVLKDVRKELDQCTSDLD